MMFFDTFVSLRDTGSWIEGLASLLNRTTGQSPEGNQG